MKSYMVSGVTKSGRDMELTVRAKSLKQAQMVAGVYFEFFAVIGGLKLALSLDHPAMQHSQNACAALESARPESLKMQCESKGLATGAELRQCEEYRLGWMIRLLEG